MKKRQTEEKGDQCVCYATLISSVYLLPPILLSILTMHSTCRIYHFLSDSTQVSHPSNPPSLHRIYRLSTNKKCIATYAKKIKEPATIAKLIASGQNAWVSNPKLLRITAPGTVMSSLYF